MGFPSELRLAAKTAPKEQQDELFQIADDIEITLRLLNSCPTDGNMTKLNGLWARGRRLLVTPEGHPTSNPPSEPASSARAS